MQFSWHGRCAHPYPGISTTFWQCSNDLPLELKCSKNRTPSTPANFATTSIYLFNLCKLSAYLRMECHFLMWFIELDLTRSLIAEGSCTMRHVATLSLSSSCISKMLLYCFHTHSYLQITQTVKSHKSISMNRLDFVVIEIPVVP